MNSNLTSTINTDISYEYIVVYANGKPLAFYPFEVSKYFIKLLDQELNKPF